MNNSNLPLLSVIIPLYNCEDYIERALISLSLQNINMEIIVVDDGSTDNGPQRISTLINSDIAQGGIKLLRQQNSGPSTARNKALSVAKGEYIYFLDADDFLKVNTLGKVLEIMVNNDADVGRFDAKIIPEATAECVFNNQENCLELSVSKIMSGQEYIAWTGVMAGVTLWRHIFRKSFIDKYNLRLNQNVFLEEDYLFLFDLFLKNPKVVVCSGDRPYYWVKRLSSSSNKVNQRAFDSYIPLLKGYSLLLQNHDRMSTDYKTAIKFRIVYAMQIYLLGLVRKGDTGQIKSSIKKLKEYHLYPFKNSSLFLNLKLMRHHLIKYLAINITPLLLLLAKYYSHKVSKR